ncbi:hypothetical protein HAX54_043698 [Datura stramonium]|uniref:Serpin domain-containing protein n=1 Tax=Datura stramonium TaxID=4076 RepID=A0ABS8SPX8_DATST|nr:hypothetical protein [Datura stramonium]
MVGARRVLCIQIDIVLVAIDAMDMNKPAAKVNNQVNRWAKKKTNGLIEGILPHGAVNNMTRLILANAIYFKGLWYDKFNASETKDLEFHLLNGGSKPGFLNHHVPSRKVTVGKFLIPKFKITFEFEASKVLKELGLTLPFSPCGFTKMVDSTQAEELFVSEMFHKSFIEVNEEGTEAAAVTAENIELCSSTIEKPIDFVADHPFLFLITIGAYYVSNL